MKPLDRLELVNRICDQYESEWQVGTIPDVGSFERWFHRELSEQSTRNEGAIDESTVNKKSEGSLATSQFGKQILFELLILDLHYRQQAKLNELANEYAVAFPAQAAVVTAAIDRFKGMQLADSEDSSEPIGSMPATEHESGKQQTRGLDSQLMPSLEGEGRTESLGFEVERQHGDFEVLRKHAEGGLGIVSVAVDSNFPREVALKEIRHDRSVTAEVRERFVFEGCITGQLEHPGIVPVYALGVNASGQPFYAMKFVQGRSLRRVIGNFFEGEKALKKHEMLKWWKQHLGRFASVCDAVEYAHEKGVIHRDIKPANIMVGDFGETLLVDWGLAKRLRDPDEDDSSFSLDFIESADGDVMATREGRVVGTMSYMSPEQATGRNRQVSKPADTFCLGSTLYCMLTGQAPYCGDRQDLLERVQQGEFVSPRKVNPHVPKALQAICAKAMSPKPADRYESVSQLGDDIRNWMADEPIAAWSEPLLNRLGRLGRRYRSLVAASTLFLLLSVIGLLVFSKTLLQKNTEILNQNQVIIKKRDEILELLQKTRAANYQVVLFTRDWKKITHHDFRTRTFDLILKQHEEMHESFPDDEMLAREYALALQCTGDHMAKSGNFGWAQRYLSKASVLLQSQVAQSSAQQDAELFRQYYSLLVAEAELSSLTEDTKLTEAKLRDCADLLKELASYEPRNVSTKSLLATTIFKLAEEVRRQARYEDALPLYQSAKQQLEATAALPGITRYEKITAEVYRCISIGRYCGVLAELGREAESQEAFQKEMRQARKWAETYRDNNDVDYAYSLLIADYATATLKVRRRIDEQQSLFGNKKLLDSVEEALQEGIQLAQRNLQRLPEIETYQLVLIKAKVARVRLLRLQGKSNEAFRETIATRALLDKHGVGGAFSMRTASGYLGRLLYSQAKMLDQQQAAFPSPGSFVSIPSRTAVGAFDFESIATRLRSARDKRVSELEVLAKQMLAQSPNRSVAKKFLRYSREFADEVKEGRN